MLENNHLFRRIEHKNLFRTFSRGYTRHHFASHFGSVPPNHQNIPQHYRTIQSQGQFYTQDRYANSRANKTICNQSLKSIPIIVTSKHSRNQLSKANSNEKFTLPVQSTIKEAMEQQTSMLFGNSFNDRKLSTNSILLNLNEHKKQDNFKLKSCLEKKFVNYESVQDQREFSVLQAKRSIVCSRNNNRLCKTSAYAFNSQKQPSRMTAINFSKYSRLLSDIVSKNKQKH